MNNPTPIAADINGVIPGTVTYKGRQFMVIMNENSDYEIQTKSKNSHVNHFAFIAKADKPHWWSVELRLPNGWSHENVETFAEAIRNFAHRTR